MTIMMFAGAATAALLSGAALAQSPPLPDAAFVEMASVGNTFEVEEAKLALDRATDPRLKSFAQTMIADLDPDMRRVIDALGSLGPKPLPKLTAAEARQQPGAADAAMQVLRERGFGTLPDPSVTARTILVDGGAGKIVATLYTPVGATGPLPVIVYFHGGGFVIANNSTYDASARMLARQVDAVVVEPEYSKAPEHKVPASHDDAIAAYRWVTQNAAAIGGEPKTIAVAGESAGGNLAVNVALAARDRKLTMPVAELIVYPMAGTDLDTPSYKMADSGDVKPLNTPMMEWFYAKLTRTPADMQDPRLDIVGKADLHGLAPATVITDQIDPLQSEGQALADKLKRAGVTVDAVNYDGVTHEVFGMGQVVGKAKAAEALAVKNLKDAFAKDAFAKGG